MDGLICILVAQATITDTPPTIGIDITTAIIVRIIGTIILITATTSATTGIIIAIITVPIRITGNGITIASMIIGDATMVRCAGMDTGEAM